LDFWDCSLVNAWRALVAAGARAIDTTAPVTSVTSPAVGSTVSGILNVQIDASDNVGVTKVEFYVDGVLNNSSSQAPASFSWETTTRSNGTHTLDRWPTTAPETSARPRTRA
jgi:hypothetical protein